MGFDRSRLPPTSEVMEAAGQILKGRGAWRTTSCPIHGGSDSLRVNTVSNGWACMACGCKGGDALSFIMQRDGLAFREAAMALGAWVDDGKPSPRPVAPAGLSARDALQIVREELGIVLVVSSDMRAGQTPSDADWERFLQASGRIQALAQGGAA